jgi:protein-L-isoaspartate(D-aspartate) O-methyltransferase
MSRFGDKSLLIFVVMFLQFNPACMSQIKKPIDYTELRAEMVKSQIRMRGVTDEKVLAAMLNVERHLFVPQNVREAAYEDFPLPVAEGQTISQPYIVAFMTEALELDSTDKVLEIGTGSGYQAAILAEICDSVFTIEIFPSLGNSARNLLDSLGYRNIFVKIGDGYEGWEENAPFDAIIVTCAPTHIPEKLEQQLAENGRMIIPVGATYTQELVLLKKKDGKLVQDNVLSVRFVPMINEKGKKY